MCAFIIEFEIETKPKQSSKFMIHNTINFLKTNLEQYLVHKIPDNGNPVNGLSAAPNKVGYPKIDSDPPVFSTGKVHLLLINLEEERNMRAEDPFSQLNREGIKSKVSPPLRLELTFLLAAKFTDYFTALHHLSCSVQFFQTNPVFTARDFPAMPQEIDPLIVEFYTMNNTQKNEIWSSLKISYLPSVAYNCKLLVYQDDLPAAETDIMQTDIRIN